jgi:glycolate oxidase iron-sulfur subunit
VQYGRLLDIGRTLVADQRHPLDRFLRALLLRVLPYPKRFHPLAKLGAHLAFLLPRAIRAKLPVAKSTRVNWPQTQHTRRVAILSGCVQPTLAPEIDAEFAQILARLQIQPLQIHNRCCGALPAHLSDEARATALAIQTIDLVWPLIAESPPQIEAIMSTASGCGVTLKEYDWLLRHHSAYKDKAARFVALVKDPVELLEQEQAQLHSLTAALAQQQAPIVYHPPCTQQHGLKIKQRVEPLLHSLGFRLLPFADAHLCCGSAGVYSLLHPKISGALRERKLAQLEQPDTSCITTANIGCLTHLQASSNIPVIHWVSLVARALVPTSIN